MLNRLQVRNIQNALLDLPFVYTEDGYFVKEIVGLDPVNATLVSTGYATADGEFYQTSRREKRNIVVRLGLEVGHPEKTVEQLRKALYQFFMPKTQVDLRFHNSDDLVTAIVGRVETMETPLFAQEPSVDVSIVCFNPDFYELASLIYPGNTVSNADETQINYVGTVNTGTIFRLLVDRTVSSFSIHNRTPEGVTQSLLFEQELLAGDVLRINSNLGQKEVILIRAAVETSILYGMTTTSQWIYLEPGINNLRVYADGAAIPYELEWINKYGGL